MTGYRYVDSAAAFQELLAAALAEPLIAVDTEAASFHRYVDRVYLIQLSTRRSTAIIDPLAVPDLAMLGALLADPRIEKVFHDADYDLRILNRDYGFHGVRMFDTRIAAQLAGEPAIGLGALVQKYLGITLAKAHQRADWSQRPLTPGMLEYAAADTEHLPALRDAMRARLEALGRLAWVEEECVRLEALRWTGDGAGGSSEAFQRAKGAKSLSPRGLATLRELYAWRATVAAQQDKALFRIIGNESLVAVSQALPRTLAALTQIPGLPTSLARRHGAALIAAVDRALALPERDLPTRERASRQPRDPEFEGRVERLKAARNQVAEQLGLDPGVLCGKSMLETIARARPNDATRLAAVEGISRWQVAVLSDTLLPVLQ
ncbi:MAG TPA: ribonuclease D [Gemmatimonadales bacterium]|nr:ribonuclease D [Gemmatimonadales bacterium]